MNVTGLVFGSTLALMNITILILSLRRLAAGRGLGIPVIVAGALGAGACLMLVIDTIGILE